MRQEEAAVPRIFIDLNRDEFSRLSDRAFAELRHPRDEARLIVREGLGLLRTLPAPDRVPADADHEQAGRLEPQDAEEVAHGVAS
jgi:hypothetical protein